MLIFIILEVSVMFFCFNRQRRNSDQNLTLKPEFENFVKKLQSGEQTEDPSDGCMTTVGRRVKTGNPIVLVGEIKHSDGTAK